MPLYRVYVVKLNKEKKCYEDCMQDYVQPAESRQRALARGIVDNAQVITEGYEIVISGEISIHNS